VELVELALPEMARQVLILYFQASHLPVVVLEQVVPQTVVMAVLAVAQTVTQVAMVAQETRLLQAHPKVTTVETHIQ